MPSITTRIRQKHDTAANWASAVNFTPMAGELIVYDADGTTSYPRFKVGNGQDNINDLPFSDEHYVLDTELGGYVAVASTQTITGAKTFSQNVNVPLTPTANTHASSKQYVDTTVTSSVSAVRTQLEKEIGLVENSVTDLSNSMTNVAVQMAGGTSLGTVLGPSGQGAITIPTIAGPIGPTGATGSTGATGPTGATGLAALAFIGYFMTEITPQVGHTLSTQLDEFTRTPIVNERVIVLVDVDVDGWTGSLYAVECTVNAVSDTGVTLLIETVWDLKGPQGLKGDTGATGEQGVSITSISIVEVMTGGGGGHGGDIIVVPEL